MQHLAGGPSVPHRAVVGFVSDECAATDGHGRSLECLLLIRHAEAEQQRKLVWIHMRLLFRRLFSLHKLVFMDTFEWNSLKSGKSKSRSALNDKSHAVERDYSNLMKHGFVLTREFYYTKSIDEVEPFAGLNTCSDRRPAARATYCAALTGRCP